MTAHSAADLASRCVHSLVDRARFDWVSLCEVASEVVRIGGNREFALVRRVGLSAVAEVLTRGWMVAGELTEKGFANWNLEPAEAIERIEGEWVVGTYPELGECCWLANTPAGDLQGQLPPPGESR